MSDIQRWSAYAEAQGVSRRQQGNDWQKTVQKKGRTIATARVRPADRNRLPRKRETHVPVGSVPETAARIAAGPAKSRFAIPVSVR